MPLVNPGVYVQEVDVSEIIPKLDLFRQLIIADKYKIDVELAPYICLYDTEVIYLYDRHCNKIGFNFPTKNYYVFNTHNFEKKRRYMTVADMCKDMTHTMKVCREEYWYNNRKYSKEGYDFIILFQRADKDRRYI